MNLFKNLFIGIIVLGLSSGIFFLLVQDQEVKDNILASTLKVFANELLAMVPEGEQRQSISNTVDKFINKVQNKEIPETQVDMAVARILNMQMSDEKPSAKEIEAVLTQSLDAPPPPQDHGSRRDNVRKAAHPLGNFDEEQLALKMRYMMTLKDDMINAGHKDSVGSRLARHAMFTADSGLQIVIDARVHDNPDFARNPHVRRFFKDLPEKDWVKFRKFDESPEIAEQAVKNFAPFLPPEIRTKIIIETQSQFDSLNIDIASFVFHADSLYKFLEDPAKFVEQLQKLEHLEEELERSKEPRQR